MDSNKFTRNSIQTITRCEQIAEMYGNQEIQPVHLLSALLDKDGLILKIIARSGCNADEFATAIFLPPSTKFL